ncbi:MAG: anthranilate synthase component I family protein [Patescibacteria group bacterium]
MRLPKITLNKKPVYRKFAEDVDFYDIFSRVEQTFETCYLLESLGEQGRFSRYSIIGFSPKHIIQANGTTLFFDDESYQVGNPYYALREIMPEQTFSRKYAGGLFGYLSYEAMNYLEPVLDLTVNDQFPRFMFGVYTDGLVYDTMTGELFYFYYDNDRLDEIKGCLEKTPKKRALSISGIRDSVDSDQHARMVEQTKEQIRAGNTFQCQVGYRREFTMKGDPLLIYEQLRQVNPSPFMFYLKFGKRVLVGASPELLFKMDDRFMETYPLAGTVKRGNTAAEDTRLARQLLNDPKEIAEHNMLVDLHRNDIGRVAELGTVKILNLMDIKKFSHVQHISSEITGILRSGEDIFSALASNFPAGTLSGAPKIESMKIIDKIEGMGRGPYGGAVGHFGFNGNGTFTIPIRSCYLNGSHGYTQASGGIVFDSVPENEYEEIQRKMGAITDVLRMYEAKKCKPKEEAHLHREKRKLRKK